jgi:hypothetical protein
MDQAIFLSPRSVVLLSPDEWDLSMQNDGPELSTLPWMCPICLEILANANTSQERAKQAFQAHQGGLHYRSWCDQESVSVQKTSIGTLTPAPPKAPALPPKQTTVSPPPLVPSPVQTTTIWCTKPGCPWNGSFSELQDHLLRCHTDGTRFPFKLLPPGEWSIDQVLEHYKRISREPSRAGQSKFDLSRIKAIETLNPVRCHVGEDSWLGYVVFEFLNHDSVVLECPITNNATYVLGKRWKSMISLSRAEIRSGQHGRYRRIIHSRNDSENWLRGICRSLGELNGRRR